MRIDSKYPISSRGREEPPGDDLKETAGTGGLTRLGIFGYAAFAIPLTGLSSAIVNLIPAYYAEVLGLSLSAVGAVFFGLRIFDAVTDPAMGWLLDRHPFKQQHKPWLAISVPIFLIAIVLLFRPVEAWVGIPYLLGVGFFAYAAYTIGSVTHQAWGADLAREPLALSRLMAQREIAVIVGILGVFLAPAIAESLGYEGLESKVLASTVYLLGTFVLFAPATLWFAPDDPAASKPKPVELDRARDFVAGREFLLVSLANLATSFALVSMSVLSYYMAAYLFESSERYGVGMTAYFVAAAIALPIWMRIAKRLGDRRTLVIACAYVALALGLTPLLSSVNWPFRYPLFTSILGLGFGAPSYLIRSLIGQLANAHEEQTGEAVRGTAFAVTTFFDKLGSGSAAGIVLPLIAYLGFQPGGEGGDPGRWALLIVGTCAPVLGFAVASWAALRSGAGKPPTPDRP